MRTSSTSFRNLKFIFTLLVVFAIQASLSAACKKDINLSKWDCMLAVTGSVQCAYSEYDVFYSSSSSGPFSKIGKHKIGGFYQAPTDGFYFMKVECGGVCHESDIVHIHNYCEPVCNFRLDPQFPEGSTINHCFDKDPTIKLNASYWIEGCEKATYKWTTPKGFATGEILHGNYGYGVYTLEIVCHDASCYGKKLNFWFKVKDICTTTFCHFDVDAPFSIKKHCYESDGDLWLSAASWVSGCSKTTFKWHTPAGIVTGPVLEGNYGYGTFTLKATCHTAECYYEEEITSFTLKSECSTHCYLDIDVPLPDLYKHCYKDDGILWLDAKSWVSGCSKLKFKWKTPHGVVNSSVLDGNYGYGKFTLTVTCHDASCYYETKSMSFNLVDDCHQAYHIYCPDDKWLSCDAELWNLDVWGQPYYYHHGKKVKMSGAKTHKYMNECNRGHIVREWKFKDPHGYWHNCSQTLFVGENTDGHPDINWPKSTLELEGCNPSIRPEDLPMGYRKPYFNNSDCSKLGRTYSDQEFYYLATCKKIVRTWTVIDWCTYNPNKDPHKGKFVKHQTIKISSDESPIVKYESEINVSTVNCSNVKVELDDLDVSAESCGDKFIITNDSPYAYKGNANASGEYPVGTTEVLYTVKYGCGYKKNYLQKIIVEAEGDLQVYCEAKLVLPLQGYDTDGDGVNDTGEAVIWAKDFDLGSRDLCAGEIYHSFSEDSLVMSRTFTCAEIGVNEMRIYVSDNRDNSTFCTVQVDVQNNAAAIKDCEVGGSADEEGDDSDGAQDEEDSEDETDTEDEESEVVTDDEEEEDSAAEENSGSDDNDSDSSETDAENETDDQDETEIVGEDDEVDAVTARASGLVKTFYGVVMPEIKIELYKMELVANDEPSFEIVDVKVDSFYSRSGALLYILAKDTIFHTATQGESMVMQELVETDDSGEYQFVAMEMNESYMIDPMDDQIDYSHVDIADANRLYTHLSGTDPLTNPYALLAADVDQSGTVDFADLDYLLAFINGSDDDLESNEMIFIEASYVFEDEQNPWDEEYAVHMNIENLEDQEYTADFVAITLGDIVPDDHTESLLGSSTRDRFEVNVSPNPFSNSASLRFVNSKTQMGTLVIYDINGARLHTSKHRLAKGLEQIELTQAMIAKSGIYIYELQLENTTHRGRILKLN